MCLYECQRFYPEAIHLTYLRSYVVMDQITQHPAVEVDV